MRREQHGVEDSWHSELGWVDGYQYAMLAREWRALRDADPATEHAIPFGIDASDAFLDALSNTFPKGTDEEHPDFDAFDETEQPIRTRRRP